MNNYQVGDYVYAKDENRVYQVKQIPNEAARMNYYNCTVVGGSFGRGFDPEASHHRKATDDEVQAASRKDKFVRVKPDTEAWDILYNVFNYQKKWDEHKDEIENFLGFSKEDNLYHSVSSLYISPKMVKEEWKDQFKKNSNPAQAKAGSKINKAWVALCKKLGLEVHELRTFQIKYGLFFTKFSVHNLDDFYVEFPDGMSTANYDWAEPVSETEFLRNKADYLEKHPELQKV